ncbi:auxin efflux carrier component 3 [Phtheirospermum japonicum]|uniref:Auxin efflux carrier component 3 n=1 Tax=Phtheirospermum japonicum TaxID=374723 RepID=A0A830B4X5_9LAMI|nr:auxin efflux carrier component 3 [Phtheirospermum japonicum]
MYSVQSSRGPTPRPSNFEENSSPKFGYYPPPPASYPAPNPEIASAVPKTAKIQPGGGKANNSINNNNNHDAKELHMFVWSSSTSPVSEVGGGAGSGLHVFRGPDFGASEQSGRSDPVLRKSGCLFLIILRMERLKLGEMTSASAAEERGGTMGMTRKKDKEGTAGLSKVGPSGELDPKMAGAGKHLPPASVMTRLILIMVWRKLIRNLNTYSSLIGLILSLISFR